jgi:transposase
VVDSIQRQGIAGGRAMRIRWRKEGRRRQTPQVTAADVQDREAFPKLQRRAKRLTPTIAHIWLDKRYTGTTVAVAATKAGVSIDIVSGPKPASGFQVQPRRWVVDPTNGSINHYRRLDRHYEITLAGNEGFLLLSQTAPLLSRLDRSQLFDTH